MGSARSTVMTMATMFLVAGCSGNGSPPNMAPPPITADETATTITTTTAPSATTTPPTTAAPATTQAPPTSTQPLVIALTDPAAIRTRSEEIARDTIGRRLNPAEQQRLVDAIHEVERESAQAAATGSEYIDVDVDAQITEYIKRTYPEETSAAQMQDAWWTMMELMCAEDPNYAPPGEPSPCPLLEIMNNEGD